MHLQRNRTVLPGGSCTSPKIFGSILLHCAVHLLIRRESENYGFKFTRNLENSERKQMIPEKISNYFQKNRKMRTNESISTEK